MISFPNAKINLGLHVTRRRDDGFHDIETVFYPVPICDTLEIYPSDERDSSLKLYGTPVHGRGENLSMKAFRLLKKEFDLPPIEIHLLKHIPSGAGMGGGSSDAAHTLIMLNNQFDLDLSLDVLEGFARQLGADCAFFIRNKPVFAFDRGDHFRLVDKNLSGKYLLIVKPDIHISTPEAYGMVNPQTGRQSPEDIIQLPLNEWKDTLTNDFEEPIFKKYQKIKSLKAQMYDQGAVYASMSGSGSAVYGIFNDILSIKSEDSFCWMREL